MSWLQELKKFISFGLLACQWGVHLLFEGDGLVAFAFDDSMLTSPSST
jgi:hypothetical protein